MTTQTSPSPEISSKARLKAKRYRIAATCVFLIGAAFSLFIWHTTYTTVQATEAERFDHYADMVHAMLDDHLGQHITVLRGIRAFIDASELVTQSEWEDYVRKLDIANQLYGAESFALIRHVDRDTLKSYAREMHREGISDFHVDAPGDNLSLAIVQFVHPAQSQLFVPGRDLSGEPELRPYLQNSAASNSVIMTGPVPLDENGDAREGMLLLLPVYAKGLPLDSETRRLQALRGWIASPVNLQDMISHIDSYLSTPLDIEIFDGDNRTVLYDMDTSLRTSPHHPEQGSDYEGLHRHTKLEVGERTLYINIVALPEFMMDVGRHLPNILLLSGALLSLAGAILITSYGRPLEEAQVLADRMTEELRQNELCFQNMFRNHDSVMLMVAPDSGSILDANSAAGRFYGLPPETLKKMSVNDLNDLTPEQLADARNQVITGSTHHFEFRHRLASGEFRDVEVHSSPIEVRGKTVLFSVIHDITPRKQAQTALMESERKYRQLFDEAAHGIAVADPENGLLMACNRKLAEMVGRSPEELVGQPQSVLHLPSQAEEKFSRSFQIHRDTDPAALIEDQLLTKDGKLINVEIKTNRLILNGRQVMQGFFYDITERKHAEKWLRESEERFRLLFETNPDPVILARFEEGTIIDVNKAFEEATRISRMDALGHTTGELGMWIDKRRREQFRQQLQREGEVHNLEAEFRVLGFPARTGLFSGRLLDISRQPCMLVSIRDITVEKAAEQSLIETDRIKTEFISTAAHELRTPLCAMMGFTELMLSPEEFGSFSPEQQHEFLREIYDRGVALTRIIDDLLDISRIESGRPISFHLHETDLLDTLTKTLEFFRVHDLRHSFRLKLPELQERTKVYIDHHRIHQVLENLIGNAAKFSPEGTEIVLSAERREDRWKICIRDHGIGMTPEQVERIFDKFYRVDSSNTAVSGLGLGMSIVRQIVEAHGGTIRVESEAGKGTMVCFTLPSPSS